MSEPAPTSYAELADVLDRLPLLVRETRRRRGLSLRGAAKDAGVQMANIARCEQGQGLHMATVLPLLRWIGSPDPATCPHCGSAPAATTQEAQSDD